MELNNKAKGFSHLVIKRSDLNTNKIFAEFYLPENRQLLDKLESFGKYPLSNLKEFSQRMFDGPFGSNRKVDMYQKSGIPYVRVKQVRHEGIDIDDLVYISEEKHQKIIRSRVVPGNVLLTIAGSQLGKAAVFPDVFEEGNITGHIAGIEVKESINPHYLCLFINSRFGKEQILLLSHRSTRKEMNLREISQIKVPFPPRKVQDRIAQIMQEAYGDRYEKLNAASNLLSGIDDFILTKLGINLEKSQRQKYFTVPSKEVIGGRFDVESISNSFDKSQYPNVQWTSLKEVANLPTKNEVASKQPDKYFSYIGMPDIDNIYGEVNISEIPGKSIKANKIIIQGNDVVFARIEPCIYNLKIALIPSDIDKALGSTELLIARPKSDTLPAFLFWILRSQLIQQQILGQVTGTTGRRRLPKQVFASLQIPVVSREEQKLIADEAMQRKDVAKALWVEAEKIITDARELVERIILGEEEAVGGN